MLLCVLARFWSSGPLTVARTGVPGETGLTRPHSGCREVRPAGGGRPPGGSPDAGGGLASAHEAALRSRALRARGLPLSACKHACFSLSVLP